MLMYGAGLRACFVCHSLDGCLWCKVGENHVQLILNGRALSISAMTAEQRASRSALRTGYATEPGLQRV